MRAALSCALPACTRDRREPLRVGFNTWPGFEYLYLAGERGFYDAEGIAVRLVELDSLSDVLRAFERGQVEAIAGSMVELVLARAGSVPDARAFYVTDYSTGADVILVRPGQAGLAGLRVGVERRSLGVYVLSRALELAGLSLADVHVTPSNPLAMVSEFRSGGLDAIVTYPPHSLDLLESGQAVAVFDTHRLPGEVLDLLIGRAEALREREDAYASLLRAFQRAVDEARREPDATFPLMARREGLSTEQFRRAHDQGMRLVQLEEQGRYLDPGGQLGPVLRRVGAALRASGQIERPPLDAESWTASPVLAAARTTAGIASSQRAP